MFDIPYRLPSCFTDIVSSPLHQVPDIPVVRLRVKDLFHFKLIMPFYLDCVWFGRVSIANLIFVIWDELGSMENRVDFVLAWQLESEVNWAYLFHDVLRPEVLG